MMSVVHSPSFFVSAWVLQGDAQGKTPAGRGSLSIIWRDYESCVLEVSHGYQKAYGVWRYA